MAKKKAKKLITEEKGLPRNVMVMGERVEADKNIYIAQSAYKDIHKFTRNKLTNESGGFLVGSVVEEMGKTNILIKGFVEAKHCDATPTTLTFTHETWNDAHKEIGSRFPKEKIIGWIHTHPDFGIFLSEYDRFIHQNYFSGENQIAFVVDPIQHIEGFYFWIGGRLEKCRGFYIYEKNGVKIDIGPDKEEPAAGFGKKPSLVTGILMGVLSIALLVVFFMNLSLNKEIQKLNDKIDGMQQQNNQLINMVCALHADEVVIQGNVIGIIPQETPIQQAPETEPETEPVTEAETQPATEEIAAERTENSDEA